MKNHGNKRSIEVFADWRGMTTPSPMGILHSELLRGKEIFSFEYTPEWLHSEHVLSLDPELQLYSGIQYLTNEQKVNFGVFLDSSPDRWGRILMRRKEAAMARTEDRPEKKLFETDYLLGVYDGHRMGALRFRTNPKGAFQNNDAAMASPPWTSLRKLEAISMKLEEDDIVDDPDYLKWLNMLVAPGSSLGGARPKASVLDKKKQLWIAKFPSKNDGDDIGGWELATHQMALQAGINMAPCKAQKFNSNHHTFLTQRFDRTPKGERLHFASAMTLLGYTDGQDHADGASYLELVEFIMTQGANVKADLNELWRRIVFNICVSNTDDHLRNHGFILQEGGWVLSPAYDINPNENGNGLKLNVSETDNALDLDLAMDVHPYFRLKEPEAIAIMEEVKAAVRPWKKAAEKCGLSRAAQQLKALAFSQSK